MSTLKEIAKLAEVSPSTVSKYLSGDIKVKEETKKRIDNAVEETGYLKSSKMAKRYGVSNLIAMIVPYVSNGKFSKIVEHVIDLCELEGFNVVTFRTKNSFEIENRIVDDIIKIGVTGAILVTEPKGQDSIYNLKRLKESGIHAVSINRLFGIFEYPSVCTDYYGSIKDVVYHLYSNGVSKIGFMLGWKGQSGHMSLFDAVEDVKKDIGDDSIEVFFTFTDYDASKYELGLEYLLSKNVSGIFTLDGKMARSVIRGLNKRGVRYPNDICVVSTTDGGNFDMMGITTVNTYSDKLAKEAVRKLLNSIRGVDFEMCTYISSYLTVRSSSLRRENQNR